MDFDLFKHIKKLPNAEELPQAKEITTKVLNLINKEMDNLEFSYSEALGLMIMLSTSISSMMLSNLIDIAKMPNKEFTERFLDNLLSIIKYIALKDIKYTKNNEKH